MSKNLLEIVPSRSARAIAPWLCLIVCLLALSSGLRAQNGGWGSLPTVSSRDTPAPAGDASPCNGSQASGSLPEVHLESLDATAVRPGVRKETT